MTDKIAAARSSCGRVALTFERSEGCCADFRIPANYEEHVKLPRCIRGPHLCAVTRQSTMRCC